MHGQLQARYYGWRMLLGVALAQVTSWGILFYSFAVFLAPMQADLGWSVATLTGAYSLALLISGVAAVPVGRWLDRHGPRLLMSTGSLVTTLLVIAWSQTQHVALFYATWAGIGVMMATQLYEPAFYLVANWFHRLRSRALTLLTFIGGLASVIYIPLANWLVDSYGWRTALVILAGILLVGTFPIHAILIRQHPGDVGDVPDGRNYGRAAAQRASVDTAAAATAVRVIEQPSRTLHEAIHDQAFWWLCGAFVCATLGTMAITVHLIPYLTEQGYSRGFAASCAGAVGLLGLPGRLIFTPLGSRVPRHIITALIFGLQAVALLVLLEVRSTTGVIAFVVLFGTGFGAITPARAAMVADLYGPKHYGSINGVLAMCITGARAAAPLSTGLLVTSMGSYRPVLWALAALSTVATVAATRARATG